MDESLAAAPVVDRDGYAYVVHPLTDGVPRTEPVLLAAWARWALEQPELRGASLLMAPEAMALPLAAAVSLQSGIPYVVVRKRPYGLQGEVRAEARTGYHGATLHVNDVRPGDRVVLIDDVLSTGGTTAALLELLARRGVVVQGVLVFMDKGRGQDIAARFDVPVRAMRRIAVEDRRVRVL